ncbi:MAG: HAMP domain-containing protein, partial [Alphaproteobacteria bacterium]|nr:HAMP domain-containing protein [Alphaproteobacteria bacterium]
MKFLNHVRLIHKILIIVGILILPLAYQLYLVLQFNNAQTDFSKSEQEGASLLLKTRDVLLDLAKARVNEIHKQKDPLAMVMSDLETLKKQAEADGLLSKEAIQKVIDANTTDNKLDAIVETISQIADKSNLNLDPDVDTFYTMDSVTVKIPSRLMEMSDAHNILSEIISSGTITQEHRDQLILKKTLQLTFIDGLNINMQKSFAGNSDGALKPALEIYYKESADKTQAMNDIIATVLAKGDAKDISQEKLDATYLEFLKTNEVLWEKSSAELQRMLQKRVNGYLAKETESSSITIGLVLLAMVVMYFVTQSITKPMSELITMMNRLAKGELGLVVPGQDRKEEVGNIARAVVGISNSVAEKAKADAAAAEATRMREEEAKRHAEEQRRQEAQQMEHMAAVERKKAMNDMADRFESSVGGVVDTVSSAATELRSSAESMAHISNQTTDRATAVAAATEEATASV